MTDKEKPENKDTKKKLQGLLDAYEKTLDAYEKANPDFEEKTYLNTVYNSLVNLRLLVEDPNEKEITWDFPVVELQYPVNVDWEKLVVVLLNLTKEDTEKPDGAVEKLARAFVDTKSQYVLRKVTNDAVYSKDENGYGLLLNEDTRQRLEKTPKRRQKALLDKLYKPHVNTTTITLPIELTPGKKKPGKLSLFFQVNPLILDTAQKRGYYPIYIGLKFKGVNTQDWGEETRKQFWDGLLGGFERGLPEEILPELPKPKTAPYKPEVALVKAGLHTELQKFGSKPKTAQESLFDMLDPDSKKSYTDGGLEVVGVDITIAQNKALYAIQTLFSKTDYKGNLPSKQLRRGDNTFGYEGAIPVLRFTPSEYLEAFGVTKRETGRGFQEYNANERLEALHALRELGVKPFLFVYERKYKKDGKEVSDAIRTVRTLYSITEGFEALTRAERDSLTSTPSRGAEEKLKALAVELSPLLVDQINSYYVLKPANYLQEIRLLVPHASKYVYTFIDWLIAQRRLKHKETAPTITISAPLLAQALRMDAWLKNKQWKQIRGSLNKCYKTAKDLGYLLDYKTVQGKTKEVEEFTLNPDKFYKMKEIETERARSTQSYS